MKKMTRREKLIWAASFIDGEGYIEYKRIPKKNGRGVIYPTIVIKIEVCNTDFAPIKFLKEILVVLFIKETVGLQPKELKLYHKKCGLFIIKKYTQFVRIYYLF